MAKSLMALKPFVGTSLPWEGILPDQPSPPRKKQARIKHLRPRQDLFQVRPFRVGL